MLPFLLPALIAGGSTLLSGLIQGSSQKTAAKAQTKALQQTLSPYTEAGASALSQMNILAGGGTPEEQAAAIEAIKSGSQYEELVQQGENAILQNAAATGGLRGGNVQGALAQYSPALLNSLISQRYSQLGGIAGIGSQVAGQLASGLSSAGATSALASGSMWNAIPNALMSGLGMYSGLGGTFGTQGNVNAQQPVTYPNQIIGGRNVQFAAGGGW